MINENGDIKSGEIIPPPEERLGSALSDLKRYTETIDRLDRINLDLEFGILEDVPKEAEQEAEQHTKYSQRLAEYYFGSNYSIEDIAKMSFFNYVRLGKRMAKEIDLPTLLGDTIKFTTIMSRYYQSSRRKTIGTLEKAEDRLAEIELIVAKEAFESYSTPQPPLGSGSSVSSEHSTSILKAAKVLNGVTKDVLPGDTDFQTLRELISSGGVLLFFQAAPYLEKTKRLRLGYNLFRNMMDPEAIQNLFGSGEWYLYLRSRRAPETLVELFKQYQNTFKEIKGAESRTASLSQRVSNTYGFLRQVATSGIRSHIDKALIVWAEIQEQDGVPRQTTEELASILSSRIRYIEDENLRAEFESRIDMLTAAS